MRLGFSEAGGSTSPDASERTREVPAGRLFCGQAAREVEPMQGDRNRSLKWQRYEVKYLVSESQAAEVRRWCLDHLPPDPHSLGRAGYEYPILSAYLDSASRTLLRQTLEKQMSRYKLRVRTYRDFHEPSDGLSAFFEIKRKINGIVHKTRARVGSEVADSLLWGEHALFAGHGKYGRDTRMNVNEFLQLRGRIEARPVVGVFYMREAYEGLSTERTRITLDRRLHYGIMAPPENGQGEMWWPADAGGVILEVKFTNTYPFWVADMLRRVEVLRRGVCKYVICSRAAGAGPASGTSLRQYVG